MRLRNVKDALEKLEASKLLIENKQSNQFFKNNDKPLFLEIGMGKGGFILEHALSRENHNFIGIEKYPSVQYLVLNKIKQQSLPIDNLKFISGDALFLDEWFKKETIDGIYLNFSDPWPKKKHEKRRLTYKTFISQYFNVLKKHGFIEIKTDQKPLYNFSFDEFDSFEGFEIVETSLDLHETNKPKIITTEYEERFIKQGKPIYFIKIIKK